MLNITHTHTCIAVSYTHLEDLESGMTVIRFVESMNYVESTKVWKKHSPEKDIQKLFIRTIFNKQQHIKDYLNT